MAMCSNCKTNVGCGCQLKAGLCGGCYSKSNKAPKIKDLTKDIKNDKNAISKTS